MNTREKTRTAALINRGIIWISSALLLISFATKANAQGDTGGTTPPSLTPGNPSGSYPLSGFDNVNLFNGNLNFHLPLLKAGGRGNAQIPLMLKIEERWRVIPIIFCSPCEGVYYATYNWWTGYQVGYGPGIMEARTKYWGDQQDPQGNTLPVTSLLRFTFTASDGTEYELRDVNSDGSPQNVNAGFLPPGVDRFYNRGAIFKTSDGSSATFISCLPNGTLVPISDGGFNGDPYPTGYLLFRDGTRYWIEVGLVRWVDDRNGNRINYYYDSHDISGNPDGRVTRIIDSLNQQVTIAYDVNEGGQYGLCDKITYQGYAQATRTIRISKGSLSSALRSDFPPPVPTYEGLFPDVPGSDATPFVASVITAVWLPDNVNAYKFSYNYYGELARVVLPSGGAIEYDWGAGIHNSLPGGVINGTAIYRRVHERRVYTSSAAGTPYESRSTYSVPETFVPPIGPPANVGYVDFKQYGTGPNPVVSSRHYFYGSGTYDPAGNYTPWKFGKEYKTESFDSDGVSVLQRTESDFNQQSPAWWPYAAADAPENNPRLVNLLTTWVQTNQVSKQHYTYDEYNNRTAVDEYDYGLFNPPASPIRRTEVDYVKTNESNGIDYTGAGIAADVNQRPYLRSLPQEQRVYAVNASGVKTQYAKTHFYYDQTALQDLPGLVGHDPNYHTGYNNRGNVTSTVKWLDTGGSLTNSMQYDIAGHVIQMTDGRGNTTTTEFAASLNTYAFATTMRTPIPDPSGQHGTSGQLVTQYAYDLSTGLVTSITNSNNKITTAVYNDPFDRLTSVSLPTGGGQITYSYGDTPGGLYVQTSKVQDASTTINSIARFDGLGRTYRTEQSEGSGSIFIDTQYDTVGRVLQVSNPYRTGDTLRWTSNTYDALNRVRIVTLPGGAQIVTDYVGNAVTVTDPAQKSRKAISDAMGRTIQVIEDPGSLPHLNYQTNYVYDVLNNLRQATQGTGGTQQNRYYLYDSLSRLIRASNPEYGINIQLTPAMTDPITNRSQWSMGFSYDPNGNMLTRTDPRNVITGYTYDNLNRITGRSYTNNINQTPTVDFTYDGIGMNPPAQNALGQLTRVSATSAPNFSSSYTYDNFDDMGRVLHTTQSVDGQSYPMGYQYDLSGNLIWEQYPSNRIVTMTYDQAGRLNDLSSGATHYASAFNYTAHGGIKDLKLGNTLWEHMEFDPYRLQPVELRLGTTQGATDKLKLNFDYGSLSVNNGDLLGQTITIPGGPTLVQSFTYDGVNRLKTTKEMQGATTIWQQSFTYDPFGNRSVDTTATTPGYVGPNPQISTATNRIIPRSGEWYDYDSAGNLTHDATGHLLDYDAENMQVKYDTTVAQYFYDGNQRRVKTIANGKTINYVYDALGRMVAEYSSGSATGSGTSYLTSDALGSPRIITGTDTANIVKARHDYLPFGEEIGTGVGGRTAGQGYVSDAMRQKYTGKERDAETGLDYFMSRYYASSMGRFMSADSVAGQIGKPQTMNRYAYVLNNPLVLVDPTGHISESQYDGTDDKLKLLEELEAQRRAQEYEESLNGYTEEMYENGLPAQEPITTTAGVALTVFTAKEIATAVAGAGALAVAAKATFSVLFSSMEGILHPTAEEAHPSWLGGLVNLFNTWRPDAASTLQLAAQALQSLRPEGKYEGTTAVALVYNTKANNFEVWVSVQRSGMPKEWGRGATSKIGSLRFISGKDGVHAEENILNHLGNTYQLIAGGTSRNVCKDRCAPALAAKGMTLGGMTFNGQNDKTPFRAFWAK